MTAYEAKPDLGFMAMMMELGIILRTALGNLEEYRRVNDPYKMEEAKKSKRSSRCYD